MVHDRFATLDSPRLDTWDFRGLGRSAGQRLYYLGIFSRTKRTTNITQPPEPTYMTHHLRVSMSSRSELAIRFPCTQGFCSENILQRRSK